MSDLTPRRVAAKRLAGLAIRTTNAAESDPATAKIPALWGRFMSEGWADKLERAGAFGPVAAVYSAYETDASGSYQLLVGREVPQTSPVPSGLQVVAAPLGSYVAFRFPGPIPQAVIDGWREVWAYFARPGAPARAYSVDYEFYHDGSPMEIWVAVRVS